MSDISQLTLPNGNSYSFKDLTARENISCIAYGQVNSTSTSTNFTATVNGITELKDGICVILQNGVVTSASGFTVNINSLGAKKCYNNMTNATQDTTIFNINYTMLFIYSSALDSGEGGWWIYRGYNSDNNTIGYQLRTNATVMPTVTRTRYYRLLFTSADRTKWVPANTGYDNSATSKKTVNQNAIDPHGRIVYMSGTTNVNANANVGATVCWDQYTLNLGYSFNTTTSALEMIYPAPVFVKCAPQNNGSAIIDSTTPIVQALPSTADGKIYIYLGMAYNETNIELVPNHPVYEYKDDAIRLWTNADISITPSSTTPNMDGTAAIGISTDYARADHVHPTDTSRQATLVSGTNIKTIGNQSLLGSGNLTVANIGAATSSHVHGDITNGGDITATAPTIASGDKLVINDESASKITNGPAFGTSTTTYLRNDGTWATPSITGNYLPLTGGILTGVLNIEDQNIDRFNPPSSANIYDRIINLKDVNSETLGFLQLSQSTNGNTNITIGAQNSDDSDQNQVMLGYSLNDNPFVWISQPSAWRSALGLGNACVKTVDNSISSTSSTNLPTTAAVTAYTDDIIVIDENEPTSSLTKIWIKI